MTLLSVFLDAAGLSPAVAFRRTLTVYCDHCGLRFEPGHYLHVIVHSQERYLEGLLEEIRTARCSDDVYPSTAKVNASLLRVAASTLHLSEDEAAIKLQQKLMLPVRKPAKGMALVVAYQYIKRVMSHLNSSLTSTAVAAFFKHMHTLKGMGSWTSRSASSARRILKLSTEECSELLRNESFIADSCGRLAMLEALASVVEEVGGTPLMVSWSGPNKTSRVIRCRFGHFANVSCRVS